MSLLTIAQYERMKWVEYGQSKWGDIALAKYLDWTYGPKTDAKQTGGEIIAISLHPGESNVWTTLDSRLFFLCVRGRLRLCLRMSMS